MNTREIKFKAWDIGENQMVYGLNHILFAEVYRRENTVYYDNRDKGVIIMEYTGLKDKNGKEIYEGDVVDCENGILREIKCFGPVYYGVTPGGDFCMLMQSNNFKESEVIGNIYENPELLEK
ncbi:MAG: YopX family protein [candidate division WOR-3 bacterium]|nr:YopX family protein [candidate division WOR-3 bacterium]